MINLKIADKEYNLPEGWWEVNLEKFEKIMLKNSQISEYKSQILFGLDILGILIDAKTEDLKNITRGSFATISEEIKWINEPPVGINKDIFIIEGEEWRPIKDLNKLTMGDNISLELMISESNEATLLVNILPILMRRVKKIKLEGGLEGYELLPFDSEKYNEIKELLKKNINITDIINFKDFFLGGEKVSSTTMKVTSESAVKSKRKKK